MRNKIIIFDMDGVLFDTIPLAEQKVLKNHPGMTRDIYKSLHSGNYHEEIKKYRHLKKEETEEEMINNNNSYAEMKSNSAMFTGVKEMLDDLYDKRYHLVLNTNAFIVHSLLERSEIKHFFDFIATADLSRSKVEKFKLIKERYNSENKDMLFITDSLGDVKEANVSGIPTVAVTWGVHGKEFFNKEKYDNLVAVVHTVDELSNFIKNRFE